MITIVLSGGTYPNGRNIFHCFFFEGWPWKCKLTVLIRWKLECKTLNVKACKDNVCRTLNAWKPTIFLHVLIISTCSVAQTKCNHPALEVLNFLQIVEIPWTPQSCKYDNCKYLPSILLNIKAHQYLLFLHIRTYMIGFAMIKNNQ